MAEANVKVAAIIDARGLTCPLPLVKLRQAFMVVERGARVCLLATDPQTPRDVDAFCEAGGHCVVDREIADGLVTLVVEKAG